MKQLILAFLLLSPLAYGQAKAKEKIRFICSCDDKVGGLFATGFRDALARSPRYEETQIAQSGKDSDTVYNWVVDVVSIDMENPAEGNSSAFSIVLKLGNTFYFDHWVQICGQKSVDSCVNSMLSVVDNDLTKFK